MFTRIRASGLWVPRTAVTPEEWEQIDQNLSDALDGKGGGAYAPSPAIEIGGDGMVVAGPLTTTGQFIATGEFIAENVPYGFNDLTIPKNILGRSIDQFAASVAQAPVWNDVQKRWFVFSHSSGVPFGFYTSATGGIFSSVISIPTGASLTLLSSACNPSGVMVLGGSPGGASTQKIRETTDGTTWNIRNTVNNGAEGVGTGGLVWFAGGGFFVAGLNNAVTTNIETSPDGITWTQRTGANAHARGAMATNGVTVVVLPISTTTTDKCISSANGIAWGERTLPTSQVWRSVVWDSYYLRFIAFGDTKCAFSSDGITWTDGGNVPAANLRYAACGRVIMAISAADKNVHGGYFDSSVPLLTMSRVFEVDGSTGSAIGAGDKQFLFGDVGADGDVYWTIRGGMT